MAELLANRTLNIPEVKLAPMGLASEVSKAPVVVLKLGKVHIWEHSDQSFRDYPITYFGLNRSLIPRLSDHF